MRVVRWIIVLCLMVSNMAGVAQAQPAPPRIHPALLQLADSQPNDMINVIVQRKAQEQIPAQALARAGGKVTKELPIINGFAMEIPARAVEALAKTPGVRWISLDAPVRSTQCRNPIGLAAAYAFEDGSGPTVSDASGNGNVATINGATWHNNGKYGGGMSFDGSNDWVMVDDINLVSLADGLTLSAWVYPTNLSTWRTVVSKYESGQKLLGIWSSDSSGRPTGELHTSGSLWSATQNASTLPLTSWSHLAMTYDGTTMKFYVNGQLVDSEVRSSTFTGWPNGVTIGRNESWGEYFAGRLDEVRVYHRVLAQSELQVDMTTPLCPASNATTVATVRDNFSSASYGNNNGSITWAGNWTETDPEGGGTSGGQVLVTNGELRLDDTPDSGTTPGIVRTVNLATGAPIATLSFDFRTTSGVDSNDAVTVEISDNGGASYTALETFTNIVGTASGSRSYNISDFMASNTTIRFRVTNTYGAADEYFFVDNVQIEQQVTSAAQSVQLIPQNTTWRYLDNGSNQGTSWRDIDHDDSAWATGNAELGYGDGDEATVVSYGPNASNKYVTTYFRHAFQVLNPKSFTELTMQLRRDDGAVVYLNGKEIVRTNMPNGAVSYTTYASSTISDGGETTYHTFAIDPKRLAYGENVLAVEVHQANATSSDISFDLGLSGLSSCANCIDTGNLANSYIQATNADLLWRNAPPLDGKNVTVAVVDSGIAPHGDLRGAGNGNLRIKTAVDLSSNVTGSDGNGHGTHVAGIIGGNGKTNSGARIGIAPKVDFIDVKVSNEHGVSLVSDVVEGLQWIYDNHDSYNIRVVNLSLNSSVPEPYHLSPLSAAVEILWFNGIVVVVAAGNNGTGSGPVTLYPPANDPFVITVGAVEDAGTPMLSDDSVASFSAYGTTADGFAKPDLVAPGRNIISLLANTTARIYVDHPTHRVDEHLFRMTGTSMATPMVTGAVALMLQDEPNLTPDQVKYRLKATANINWPGYSAAQAGAGYLDIHGAVNSTSTATANTGIAASQTLWTGDDPVAWDSVSWNSVSWNSVSWNSVSWNSVSWNSVSWNSEVWNSTIWDEELVSGSALTVDLPGAEDWTDTPAQTDGRIMGQATPLPTSTDEESTEEQDSRIYLPFVNR